MSKIKPEIGKDTAFKKGQSGNPGGRPKTIKEVQELAREQTVPAIMALVANLAHENGAVVNTAAEALLNRGWGKAPLTIAGEGGEGPVKSCIRVEFVEPQPRPERS